MKVGKEIVSQSTQNRNEMVENEVHTAEASFRVEPHKRRTSQWPLLYMESLFLDRQVYTKRNKFMGMPFVTLPFFTFLPLSTSHFPSNFYASWLDHLVLFQSGHWCQINLTKNCLHDVISQFKTLFQVVLII